MIPEYNPVYTPRLPKSNIDSIIINQKHIALFANWIDRKEEKYIPYEFNLLYRASRDHGNTAAAFHSKCDNKGATIVVVKITNSKQIVGGYNPLFWDSSDSGKYTMDSFIFSFTDKNNLQSSNVVYSKGDKYSIYCGRNNGPAFGKCCDLYCSNNGTWYSKRISYSYPKIDIPHNFNPEEYEVFQVIKK